MSAPGLNRQKCRLARPDTHKRSITTRPALPTHDGGRRSCVTLSHEACRDASERKRTRVAVEDAGEDLRELRREKRRVREAVREHKAEGSLEAVVREDAGVEVAAEDGLAGGVAEDLRADLSPERVVVRCRGSAQRREDCRPAHALFCGRQARKSVGETAQASFHQEGSLELGAVHLTVCLIRSDGGTRSPRFHLGVELVAELAISGL